MAEKPKRIQRKRTKGWKMPYNTVSVTRPGRFGNPFVVGGHYKLGDPKKIGFGGMTYIRAYKKESGYHTIQTKEEAVEWYKKYMELSEAARNEATRLLRGKNLACFCKEGEPCHADILLEIANS